MTASSHPLDVANVAFTPAPEHLQRSGLCGWVTCQIGGLRVDGVALRAMRDGHLGLSYPCRRDAQGREHPYVLPADPQARAQVEQQILATLEAQEWIVP